MTRFGVVAYDTSDGVRYRVEPVEWDGAPDPVTFGFYRSLRRARRMASRLNTPAPVKLGVVDPFGGPA